jgi:nitric oxide dioxygenase
MTPAQIQLVKKSWRLLRGVDPEVLAGAFYSRLFVNHPELRRLFPKNMQEQHRKLVDMLNIMVARLDQPDELRDELAAMARRHAGYGAKARHYDMVGEALLQTLENGLGDDWTAETADAWRACYEVIASAMKP